MRRITRKLEFDAGHRVYGHESKCAHLHGHRYVAEVTVEALHLDGIGRVIDFSVVKSVVGGWIDEHWDHNLLLNSLDPIGQTIDVSINGKTPYFFQQINPTAENMVETLYTQANQLLRSYGLRVCHVRIYETPNCWADYGSEHTSD